MTGQEMLDLNTEIRGGREMDSTTFFTLANLARVVFEGKRPWRQLVTRDNTSNSSSAANTYATAYTLPTRFSVFTKRTPITLVNGNGRMFYTEIPLEDFDSRRDEAGLFAIDLSLGKYYLSGVIPSGTWTHYLNFAKRSQQIAAGTTWQFPEDYHPYIPFEVAVMDQLGIDYDDTNARQGVPNAQRADMVLQVAVRYDDTLMRNAMSGIENR